MNLFIEDNDDTYGTCDVCGTPLDPEDASIHLCKFCQEDQFDN